MHRLKTFEVRNDLNGNSFVIRSGQKEYFLFIIMKIKSQFLIYFPVQIGYYFRVSRILSFCSVFYSNLLKYNAFSDKL